MSIEKEMTGFQETLSKELTNELASLYVQTLQEVLTSDGLCEGILEIGEKLHFQVAKELYGPLLAGYVYWVEKNCSEINHSGPVYFALRDAAPLMEAASILWQGKTIYAVGIYANRPLLGIEDQISSEAVNVNGDIEKYFKGLGLLEKDKILWADSGAWGTVIKVLKQGLLKNNKLYPFFWFSHNPHIPGYINNVLTEIGVDESWGEVLNDSIECVFPQEFLRPLGFQEGIVGLQAELKKSGPLSQAWGKAALLGVREAATEYLDGVSSESQHAALIGLIDAQKEARDLGKWTGVLPRNTPTWPNGEDFVNSWPEKLLP